MLASRWKGRTPELWTPEVEGRRGVTSPFSSVIEETESRAILESQLSRMAAHDAQHQPVSRTYQYRKVMKPMLERKRRARINRCLDELKELMVTALQSEGENVSKLEKADILELTVRHLQSLRSASSPQDRYDEGWTACLDQVNRFLKEGGGGGLPASEAVRLIAHLTPEVSKARPEPLWRPW
ncbi:hypothetical protein GE061_011099 [Apolygus lucorum]|uniref:Uncharacterized protein n=1 Tax=Apolygus lucorum TaxID=248454 RepID=A0A6A4K916_APOLU|nr:hypothetical protein GE061_011099 [Apolygus lucorum]